MSIYYIVLFLHIVGAIGYFLGIDIWLFILLGLRRTQRVEQVHSLIHLNALAAENGAASAVLLLVTGLYLALVAWSLLTSWILVALISLLLMVPTSAALIAPRRSAIVKQLAREAPGGELPKALEQHIDDPVLATVCTTILTLLLGLVFLMTTKPALIGSLIVMVVVLLLGLAAGALLSRMRRAPPHRGWWTNGCGTKSRLAKLLVWRAGMFFGFPSCFVWERYFFTQILMSTNGCPE